MVGNDDLKCSTKLNLVIFIEPFLAKALAIKMLKNTNGPKGISNQSPLIFPGRWFKGTIWN